MPNSGIDWEWLKLHLYNKDTTCQKRIRNVFVWFPATHIDIFTELPLTLWLTNANIVEIDRTIHKNPRFVSSQWDIVGWYRDEKKEL